MLDISAAEITQALESAKNINAATKKFLKLEVSNDPKSLKFIKNLRPVLLSKDPNYKQEFVARHLPDYQAHFLVLGRYAFIEQLDAISYEITSRYAEEFNATYENKGESIEVTNREKFNKIVSEASMLISQELKKQQLPENNYFKTILLNTIFDAAVLKEVLMLI